ncbi:MAG: hemagglutinin, partial [Verrucomicrobia bacterium]|nr:hemagglutinin [Verrucomicrobiota bacterium]
GSGAYGFSGFSAVNLNASQGLTAQGNIDLKAASNLNITTPYVTAGRSTNAKIDASGYAMQLLGTGSSAKPASEALGARLELTADTIVNSTSIDLPSGAVTLAAKNGNLTLASGSKIDVSGRSVTIGTQNIATDGGLIGLSATNGSVSLASNAALALGGDRGGVLKVAVPQGRFDWQGTIDAKGASSGSSFDLTLGAAADLGSLGTLGSRLKQSGFTDAVRLDAATGDLILAAGDTLEARLVSLVAEKGGMDVSGTILSQGKNAEIDLLAARQINLNSSANLVAQGTLGGGGRVVMDTVTLNPSNTQGVAVAGGTRINTTSSTGNANGSVLFRVQRGDSSIALSGPVGSAISGAANTVVEAQITRGIEEDAGLDLALDPELRFIS